MLNNIYLDQLLKYPLTRDEYNNIEKAWEFLELFKKPFILTSDFRNYIVNKVPNTYSIEQFYEYEYILNKLFWNLRWFLFPLYQMNNMDEDNYKNFILKNFNNISEIPEEILMFRKISYCDDNDLKKKLLSEKLLKENFYRSFINKLIIVDKNQKLIYSKEMEGSSQIFCKNYFNSLTFNILFNRELYEKIMKDPFIFKNENIKLSKYYYQHDYGFPNLNCCNYLIDSKENRMNRIKKMYYGNNFKKYWFKLII